MYEALTKCWTEKNEIKLNCMKIFGIHPCNNKQDYSRCTLQL